MNRTPGTRRTWSTLREWFAHMLALDTSRVSAQVYINRAAHLGELGRRADVIGSGTLEELLTLRGYVKQHRPPAGLRQGTSWTRVLELLNNEIYRREQLEADTDRARMEQAAALEQEEAGRE